MTPYFEAFPLVTVAAGIIMTSLGIFAVLKRNVSGSGLFALLMFTGAAVAVLYYFELLCFELRWKVFFLKSQYIGVPYIATFWFFVALHFCGYGKFLKALPVGLILVLPFVTMVIAWTNDYHYLSWTEYGLAVWGNVVIMDNSFGVWHWVHIAYSYTIFLAGAVLFIRMAVSSNSIYRGQSFTLIAAASVPWIGSIIFSFQSYPISIVDTTPTLFAISGFALWWAIFRYHLLNVMPAAKEAVLENMRAGILVMDLENRIVEINSYLERAFNLKAKSILGRKGDVILDKLRWEAGNPAGILQGEASYDNGADTLYFDLGRNTLYDMKGRKMGSLLILFDITGRKKAELSLKKTEELLFQVQKMEALGRMAGGIAHDFNNILTIILNYSENLMPVNCCRPEEIRESIEEIYGAVRRGQGLTNQLLAFSELQLVEKDAVSCNQVVAEMERMIGRLLGSRIKLHIINEDDTGVVWINKNQVEQIILNLVINARDAMPAGGVLTIRSGREYLTEEHIAGRSDVKPGYYSLIEVCDTGEGIDSSMLKTIFEPFFTTKGTGRGAGLGLSTVYGIVKQNRGHIEVKSGKGQGTLFRVYFPLEMSNLNLYPARTAEP